MVAPTRTPLRAHRLRALNLPLPVMVELDERGEPVRIAGTAAAAAQAAAAADQSAASAASAAAAAGRSGARSRVEEVIEVWRVDDEWWRDPICRRYVEVALQGGGHVVLFEDLTTGNWFMQQP